MKMRGVGLYGFFLLAIFPGLAALIFVAAASYERQRANVEADVMQTTRALSQALEGEILGAQRLVQAIAVEAPDLARGDLAAFDRRARAIAASMDVADAIALTDRSGQLLVNTLARPGEALPRTQNLERIQRVFASGKPLVSEVLRGTVSKRLLVAVDVPVMRDGRVAYVLNLVLLSDRIGRILARQHLPREWIGVIYDRNGTIVARTLDPDKSVGNKVSDQLMQRLTGPREDAFQGATREGTDVIVAYSRSEATGYSVAVGVPSGVLLAQLHRTFAVGILAIGALFLASLLFAYHFGGKLLSSLHDLGSAMDAAAEGRACVVPAAGPAEVRSLTERFAFMLEAQRQADAERSRLTRALRLLSDCNLALVQARDEQMLLSDICRRIVESGGYMMAWVGIADDDSEKTVRPVAQSGYEEGYLDAIAVSWDEARDIGRGPTGIAIRTGKPQADLDCLDSPAMAPWWNIARERGYRSSLALPLIGEQRTFGALTLYAAEPDAFNAGEIALLEELARNVAFGVEAQRTRVERSAAEAAAAAKSVFLANISHEIRTPLHVIIGLAHLMRRHLRDPSQVQRLDQLCANSDHLLALINDVLDISKIEANMLTLDRRGFRLGTVIEHVVAMTQGSAQAKGLAVAVDVPAEVHEMLVHGDALRLTQVLLNLSSNAVKFTDHGSVRIAIAGLDGDAGHVRLRFTVEDTGIGISPAIQSALFRPFVQADESWTRERGGTGLGLAISQRLVELMGGTIRIDSRPGAGSRFSFEVSFPVAQAVELPGPAAAADISGRYVLLVEDHALSQEIIYEMLEDLGCDVDVAADGAEAVACARERGYDLILMDMQMPKMDGIEATRAIRALPGYDRVPIIALTANAFGSDRERCLEAGMDGHVGKPVTPTTLAAALGQWLPDVTAPKEDRAAGDSELGRALRSIEGLETPSKWLRSQGDLASYRALLQDFAAQQRTDVAQWQGELAAGQRESLRRRVHDLKGIAGLVGARKLAGLAERLHERLRSGADGADLVALIEECSEAVGKLAAAVSNLPDGTSQS